MTKAQIEHEAKPDRGVILAHRQHNRVAHPASLRFWARSIGDINPRHVDEGYKSRTGGTFAPHPCWLYSTFDGVAFLAEPGTYPVLAGADWVFRRPLAVGEKIQTQARHMSRTSKMTSLAGEVTVDRVGVTYLDQRDEAIATLATTLFHIEPDRARKNAVHAAWVRSKYSDEQLDAVEAAYDNEFLRGPTPLYVEDVSVGDEIPAIVRGALTSEEIVLYLGATRPAQSNEDFVTENMASLTTGFVHPSTGLLESWSATHVDDASAKLVGFPGAHDLGSDRVSQCATQLLNWAGDTGRLTHLNVRLLEPHMLGDTSWFSGRVTKVGSERGVGEVQTDLTVTNQHGVTTAAGTATVVLPARGRYR